MSDHIERSIQDFEASLAEQLGEVKKTKLMLNMLYERLGRAAPYADASDEVQRASLNPSEFYGIPLATVVRTILERRKAQGRGPASANDIYEAMKAGGYHFDTKNDENAKRSLYATLSKNTQTFHRIPSNGFYGLREWFPNIPRERAKAANGQEKDERDEKPLHEELQEEVAQEAAEAARAEKHESPRSAKAK